MSESIRSYATRSAAQAGPSTFSSHSEPSERRPVTPSVMADLELEPVSPDDDSLDMMDDEEEEVGEPGGKSSPDKKADAGSKDMQKAPPASESQRSGSPEEGEAGDRRRKSRVPIELVDFGEAARHARATAGPSASGGGGGSAAPSNWGNRRQEGRAAYVSQPVAHPPPPPSLPPPPPPPPVLHQSQR